MQIFQVIFFYNETVMFYPSSLFFFAKLSPGQAKLTERVLFLLQTKHSPSPGKFFLKYNESNLLQTVYLSLFVFLLPNIAQPNSSILCQATEAFFLPESEAPESLSQT